MTYHHYSQPKCISNKLELQITTLLIIHFSLLILSPSLGITHFLQPQRKEPLAYSMFFVIITSVGIRLVQFPYSYG